ncbi:MAG: 5-formyltetrahydrofolate cyclo-ligase [Granulosicoccus sp.]|nr:5-formyltetrahydrofolate cyclo-ligase [Granulosicoccus sp.]
MPDLSAELARANLRTSLLGKRKALSAAEQDAASTALLQQLKPCLKAHGIDGKSNGWVAGYLASRGEINVAPTLDWLRSLGWRTVLPVISVINEAPGLLFAPFNEQTPMKAGKFNIPIPDVPVTDYITAAELDLVLVPLVGFDHTGNRLGMGGGYYDRTFAFRVGLSDSTETKQHATEQVFIGVAHECQRVDTVPIENWDIPLQAVATDHSCYYPDGND